MNIAEKNSIIDFVPIDDFFVKTFYMTNLRQN